MGENKDENFQVVAVNRVARHEYFIEEIYEAGIELKGSEVKSIRDGGVNLKEGYAHVQSGQMFLEGVHVTPYAQAGGFHPDPIRPRRLLMHRREIDRIGVELSLKRLTLVPLRMYLKGGRVKVEIGLAKGKKAHDKRQSIKKREASRQIERAERTRR